MRCALALCAGAALVLATPALGDAQRGGRGLRLEPNVPYTGQFTFVRLRYGAGEGLGGWGGRSGWAFDYPQMERNFMTVLADLTTMRPRVRESNVLDMDDPGKRLLVIINYNNDIGDYMEWSGQGWYPVNFTNDAYKFATNYLEYAVTHGTILA